MSDWPFAVSDVSDFCSSCSLSVCMLEHEQEEREETDIRGATSDRDGDAYVCIFRYVCMYSS